MGAVGARVRSTSPFTRRLTLVAFASLAWRVLYASIFKHPVDACGRARCGDAIYYVAQARSLVDGAFFEDPAAPGMPAADHPPVTALALVPAALTRSYDIWSARMTMALIGTAAVVVIALLARHLAGERAGLLAGLLAAANPNLWMNDALPMSEAPAALAVATVLLGTYLLAEQPTTRRACWLGLACGLAVLTRGELALLVPLTVLPAVAMARGGPPLRKRLWAWVVVGLVGVATVAPWTLFNLNRFAEPVLLSTNEGLTVLGANCDPVYHGGGVGFWNLGCALDLSDQIPEGADQSERSHIYRDEGLRYVADNRGELARVVPIRIARVWTLYGNDGMVWLNQNEGRESWASWAGIWWLWATTPLAIVGLVGLARRQVAIWPLLSTAVLVTLTAALFYGIVRFRVPADVAGTAAAGVGLAIIVDRWWPRRASPLVEQLDS